MDDDRYFEGLIDEVVIIPSAVDSDGVHTLMNSTYPTISIDDDFLTLEAGPLSSITSNGTAQVDENAISGVQRFEQEVEAALELQQPIDFPILDGNVASLQLFLPFEDVPGVTVFENVVGDDLTCLGDSCPTAGLRGIIDRAAFFDGLDDHFETSPVGFDISSVSVLGERRSGHHCRHSDADQ